MANEIVEITRDPISDEDSEELVSIHVVYLYNLADYGGPIMIEKSATKVILQTRGDLPAAVIQYGMIPESWLAGIDAGDAVFIEQHVPQEPGETLPEVLEKARLRYAKGATVIARQRARWLNAGKRYDA